MQRSMIESLETRDMLSVTAPNVAAGIPASPMAAIHMTPFKKAAATLVGTYKGNLTINAVAHFKSVVLSIKTLSKAGAFTGTLTAQPGVSLKVAGVLGKRGFTISITGTHPGGTINGTGTGTFDAGYKHLTIKMSFKNGSQVLPGTIVVARA